LREIERAHQVVGLPVLRRGIEKAERRGRAENALDESRDRSLLGRLAEDEAGLGVGRNDEKWEPETEAVRSRLGSAVLARGRHVIVPSTEIVHREEDRGVFPVLALHDLVHVLDRPSLAVADAAERNVETRERQVRMLAVLILVDEPGDRGERVILNIG